MFPVWMDVSPHFPERPLMTGMTCEATFDMHATYQLSDLYIRDVSISEWRDLKLPQGFTGFT